MRILALDAATKISGWSVYNGDKLLDYGIIKATSADVVTRITKQVKEIDILLQQYSIEKIILEEVLNNNSLPNNIKTTKALMYLQSAIVLLVHESYPNIEIEFFYPSEWRAICKIHQGRGVKRPNLKAQDIATAQALLNITDDITDDEADAILIGYAYTKRQISIWT